jgi:hypothetical protein
MRNDRHPFLRAMIVGLLLYQATPEEDTMQALLLMKLACILAGLVVAVVLFLVSLGWLGFIIAGISVAGVVTLAKKS